VKSLPTLDVLQKAVGRVQGTDALHPHFLDQAILGGAEVAFDTALGLGRVGQNELDVQGFESSPDDGLCGFGVSFL
jgi:hypothetical protein